MPRMESFSASSRSVTAASESRNAAFMVFADWLGVVEDEGDEAGAVLFPADGGALCHDGISVEVSGCPLGVVRRARRSVAMPMPPPTHSVARP